MTFVRIQDRTSIADVLSWRLAACNTINLARRSAFEPGAQALALSLLASIRIGRDAPILVCDFDEPKGIEELEGTPLASPFGFALSRLVSQIQFSNGLASPTLKPLLGGMYKSSQGVFGKGTSRAVVFPDPVFQIAPALSTRNATSADIFPSPSAFSVLLNSEVESLGFRRALGSSEESGIVAFVYEALRNSLEHGLPQGSVRKSRSTRALILEKIVLQSAELSSRHLSEDLKEYLLRIFEANKSDLGLGVLCISVADQGSGIQSTLPVKAELPQESAVERLARAFLPGESRKPVGVIKRGLGLPSVISAAHSLQALLRISSGNLVAEQDFSLGEDKYPRLNLESIHEVPSETVFGTCISIFVPEFAIDRDQPSLFSRPRG
ncbi:hypothetical protein PCA20602_03016 [Pandoraea capi]|uniref:Sensor histidine kinase n=1 Tax=Pandoraea capi TaxID=2508286 RepID=A0ABY6W2H1_9BURK|nr:hypothetical protein [Pandoraea capi]VVE18482.1 hypothetical protein PCA20602_03016 [Pandoraea capi]